MDTFFYTNAARYTNEAIKDAENKQYLSSWAKTVPARINYLADSVVNVAIAPFSFLKACFGALKAIYTWGYETNAFNSTYQEFSKNIEHFLISTIGIFFTKAGIDLRNGYNIGDLLFPVLINAFTDLTLIDYGGRKNYLIVPKTLDSTIRTKVAK